MTHVYTNSGAVISYSGKYRYSLWREWRGTHDPNNWHWFGVKDGDGVELGEPNSCLFIMLNPSTADGNTDDPTIRRCVSFAKRWNFERLEVVNLFAYRATNPKELLALNDSDDPVGTDTQYFIERAVAHAGLIVCAWGEHGTHLGQDKTVRGWLWDKRLPHMALGFTKSGQPRHPLYIKSTAELQRMP